MMLGTTNIKFIDAQQAKVAYQYKNTKRKLYKTNAAIWYNKTCRQKTTHPEIYQYPYQWLQPTMPTPDDG